MAVLNKAIKVKGDEMNEEEAIKLFQTKRLIKNIEQARGDGTSMITLIMKPMEQISKMMQKLVEEYGTATNIKSRVNRQSVLTAITSTQNRLKLYHVVPPNGLIIYCGSVYTEKGEKLLCIDFEPPKPINTSTYLCDNRFHTEALNDLLQNDDKYGFIIMDGNGTLFGTLQGNTRTVLQKISVELPKKHGRGGQSSVRFARLRLEKRHNYVRQVGELAVQNFITDDRPNVCGLILAGIADFKTVLNKSMLFDQRLQAIVLNIVDVSYGGMNGFNQAIELSAETLRNVKFVAEKDLINSFMDNIKMDTGKFVFGVQETLKALEMGAVEKLIVWENLPTIRIELKHPQTDERKVLYLKKESEAAENGVIKDPETGVDFQLVESESFVDWLSKHYKEFGAHLEFVTDKSQEGAQFAKGFGGIGGILRYQLSMDELDDNFNMNEEFEHEEEDDDDIFGDEADHFQEFDDEFGL
ncbi:peptide chain release factor eRF/aRF, subunit 1, putative [Entamoeba histolytica HM-1:IMSS-B]|uniref:Eukaryotic peptide chain release factor subunit 1, putative n=7 Tax=Entamoeba histolytica TaxID=5759 RepID=C4LSV8_ENTH1|nr:eukaryotic peptide chain release factor subunit 1, putative [Entamoeba histolytica HM-1:IMSS]EMD46965.1 eukaryotic peptide chain release factor subunit 1, putative [Entamoeba histolytica KU27]EMH76320.1 peptide chain release factor eRF/aRF, subunit 1, putative [Entamoeba histolytica HM-1:IMSS-B]EMS14221.1 eukaryotic peptide chain release factor subunit 1, putative [Entamoeba histolytica HM-3:IMSS]ENY60074.1 eukaryotic peptide chain release factor subunit 1, putative [Entamoeba histolytica HM|eukprot:XP_655687.1 eukaryotic peptide chain release factor subunit 1, putative [Entamoeba histolytica HM-1:IMSS]